MAGDGVDRVVTYEATELGGTWAADEVVVLDDVAGALSLAAVGLTRPDSGRIRVWCDSLTSEVAVRDTLQATAVDARFRSDLDHALFSGARLVLLRLPKSLAALDQLAWRVAREGAGSVQLVAGGQVKHMTHGMNAVLRQHFTSVRASRGLGKARALHASRPDAAAHPDPLPSCRTEVHPDLGLTVCAEGGVFAGASIDLGTRALIGCLDRLPDLSTAIDLGCGTGVLATWVAVQHPAATVTAIDETWSAVRSATATAAANGVADRIAVRRSDGLADVASGSVDVVLCNPPFHRGTTRDSSTALRMIADAARVLRPGGELWTVYNSHLPYRSALARLVGQTQLVNQTPTFTVTRSRRRLPRPDATA